MNCLNCNIKMTKWGKRQGRQAYRCKKCDRQIIDPILQKKVGRPKLDIRPICKICGTKVHARGLCQNHYRQVMRAIQKQVEFPVFRIEF